ncbi:VirB3 family type IV secretion system protein [Ilyobacter sp.]|uniref:VirB3 family type IV secretion system protein n=1 Tax=Ilyobacter sp. TaxID=3100343 RepID=UPI0035697F31
MSIRDNYRIPICQAITKDIPVAGGPRNVVVLNSTLAGIVFLGFENIIIMPLFAFTHLLIIYAAKRDQKFFECFKRYIRHKKYYHP